MEPNKQTRDAKISVNDFRIGIEAAINQRARQYANNWALHVRFENDDSNAAHDAQNFRSFLFALSLDPPTEYIIGPSEVTPGWKVTGKLGELLNKALSAAGRSIIFVHYAGHGSINESGELVFYANGAEKKSFRPVPTLLREVDENSSFNAQDPKVDIVFIFDSCFSGTVTRGTKGQSRIVEVLAACDADSTAYGNNAATYRIRNRTFTSKLADYAARKKGKGEPLELAVMISELASESPVKKPVHRIILGPNTIRLSTSALQLAPSPIMPTDENTTNQHRAIISVHISGDLNDQKLSELRQWIQSLGGEHDLSLDSIYKINSAGLILNVPHSVYLNLNGLPGVNLVFEDCKGGNLIEGHTESEVDVLGDISNRTRKLRFEDKDNY